MVDFVAARHAEGVDFKPGTFAAEVLNYLPCPTEEVVAQLEHTNWLVLTQDTKSAARGARLVVTATSTPGTMIGPEDLQPHAVVCDVSRPANVSRQVVEVPARRTRHRRRHHRRSCRVDPESVWARYWLGLRLHGGDDDAHTGGAPAQYQHWNGPGARNAVPAAVARGPVWLRSGAVAQLRAAGRGMKAARYSALA